MLLEDFIQLLSFDDPNSDQKIALYRQLSQTIRQGVLAGAIPSGTQLPASRYLASTLSISRSTVTNAYEQLQSEGIVESTRGGGTYVCDIDIKPKVQGIIDAYKETSHLFAKRVQGLIQPCTAPNTKNHPLFTPGISDLSRFPDRYWRTVSNRYVHQQLGYAINQENVGGYKPLREAIVSHLKITRDIECTADQVFIMNGLQHATRFVFDWLCDAGDKILIEDPGYIGVMSSALMSGLEIAPLALDEYGAVIPKHDSKPKVIYLTPSHQFPMGINMERSRRLEMIEYAHANNTWIIEDDYDNEFPLKPQPQAAMKALDVHQRVLYAGTFSKVLANYIKVSYLVVPQQLAETMRSAYKHVAIEVPLTQQAIIASYIEEGYFHKHLRAMRAIYSKKQVTMARLIDKYFIGLGVRQGGNAGLHAVIEFTKKLNDQAICDEANQYKLGCLALSNFCLATKRSGLLIGFCYGEEEEMKKGMVKLSEIVKYHHENN